MKCYIWFVGARKDYPATINTDLPNEEVLKIEKLRGYKIIEIDINANDYPNLLDTMEFKDDEKIEAEFEEVE